MIRLLALFKLVKYCLIVIPQAGLHTFLHLRFSCLHITGALLKVVKRGSKCPPLLLGALPKLLPICLARSNDTRWRYALPTYPQIFFEHT